MHANSCLSLDDIMVLKYRRYDFFANAFKQCDSNTMPYILEFQLLLACRWGNTWLYQFLFNMAMP